jgi:hypothetical protein
MNLKRIAAELTYTRPQDWEDIEGPDSRVGLDYWLRHKTQGFTLYANCDQGEWSFELIEKDE